MNLRQVVLVAVAALAVGGTALAQVSPQPGAAVTPPPPPAPNGAGTATTAPIISVPIGAPASAAPSRAPSPTPAPAGRRGRRNASPEPDASPSETPEPAQFSTMDGVWEVALQPLDSSPAVYSHLYITQKGDQLSGTWVHNDKSKADFSGTFDGRLFTLTLKDATHTWTMSGYAENFADMVGLLKTDKPKDLGVPFTAGHRKKTKLT